MIFNINGFKTDKIQQPIIKKTVNELDRLSFGILEEHLEHVDNEKRVILDGHSYIIKEIDDLTVRCVYDVNELKTHYIESLALTARTIKDNLDTLIQGTGWTAEGVNSEDRRAFTFNFVNIYDACLEFMKRYNFELRFDNKNKKIIYGPQIGSDKGAYFAEGLNLVKLSKQSETYEFATRIEPRGQDGMTIAEINGGKTYLQDTSLSDDIIVFYWSDSRYAVKEELKQAAQERLNKLSKRKESYEIRVRDLASLSKLYKILDYDLGDTVKIVKKRYTDTHRIVALENHLYDPSKNTCTLSNRPLVLSDRSEELKEILNENYEIVTANLWVLDNKIESKVSEETYQLDKDSNESRFTAMSSEITQNREGITSKVDQTDYDTETGRINQQLTEMEQRADALEIAVQDGGGLNQLLNSAGYAELSFWTKTGTVEPSASTWILSESTAKHGFMFSGGSITQETLLKAEQVYTLSLLVNNLIGSNLKVLLGEKQEDGTVIYEEVYSTTETYQGKVVHEFIASSEVVLKIENSGSADAEVTDIMLAEGKNQTVWTQANGEMYTVNVLIDRNGIAVKHFDGSKTVMNPQEFAGYYNDQRIFSLNGYLTEVMGLLVKKEGLHIPPVKMVQRAGVSLDIVWTGG